LLQINEIEKMDKKTGDFIFKTVSEILELLIQTILEDKRQNARLTDIEQRLLKLESKPQPYHRGSHDEWTNNGLWEAAKDEREKREAEMETNKSYGENELGIDPPRGYFGTNKSYGESDSAKRYWARKRTC